MKVQSTVSGGITGQTANYLQDSRGMPPRCLAWNRNRHVSVRVAANARRYSFLLFASILALHVTHAAVCDPEVFHGAYGLSLTGNTTIGGTTRPVAVVGRLVLDDSENLSGISSASFTGLIFGNRVTGKYEAQRDCSVTWTLQDDSGNLQHFAGTMSADGRHVAFRQTDPGGAENGNLLRTMEGCSESSLAGKFKLTVSGRTVDVNTAVDSGRVSFWGLLGADGSGNLSLASGPDEPAVVAGTYDVLDDCFVELVLQLPPGEHETAALHFRAILVENGREVLGIQTDPGTIVALRLVSR